jgi:hypothetical protein
MRIKVGDIYYFRNMNLLSILTNIRKDIHYNYRLFYINDYMYEHDYPSDKRELTHILVNNPINKLLYPEYVEKGDFLYEKNITNANFTLNDYYKLRNAYNEGQS